MIDTALYVIESIGLLAMVLFAAGFWVQRGLRKLGKGGWNV
jgi:hypothetical protein